jgi:hypothetical protein
LSVPFSGGSRHDDFYGNSPAQRAPRPDYCCDRRGRRRRQAENLYRAAPCDGETLLAELTFSDPSAAAAAGGVLTLDPITQDSSADATGTAVWARIEDSDGTFVMDLNVGAAGSGQDIELVNTSITMGQAIGIASATITEANA